jgi:hypothetical protein
VGGCKIGWGDGAGFGYGATSFCHSLSVCNWWYFWRNIDAWKKGNGKEQNCVWAFSDSGNRYLSPFSRIIWSDTVFLRFDVELGKGYGEI